jgi:simple sugar transport system permease protein
MLRLEQTQSLLGRFLQPLAAVLISTVITALLIAVLQRSPLGVLSALVAGPLGSPYRFYDALGLVCPLLLCGLAVAVAFRAQAWNIGVEGQYLFGAIAAVMIGISGIRLPGVLLISAMLGASFLAGALYALIPVLLENRRHVPLVLSTILLNFVAISFVSYLTQGPLRGGDPSAAQSDPIAPQAYIGKLVAGTGLHWGFVIALAAAAVLTLVLARSTFGFAVRMVGLNPTAADWVGTDARRVRRQVMALSGGLGGLAGGIQIAGVHHLLNIQASEGFGYVGIAVALLGRLHPLGVAAAALAIAMLDVGALYLERQPELQVPAELADVIKGTIILAMLVMSGPRLTAWLNRRRAAV